MAEKKTKFSDESKYDKFLDDAWKKHQQLHAKKTVKKKTVKKSK